MAASHVITTRARPGHRAMHRTDKRETLRGALAREFGKRWRHHLGGAVFSGFLLACMVVLCWLLPML